MTVATIVFIFIYLVTLAWPLVWPCGRWPQGVRAANIVVWEVAAVFITFNHPAEPSGWTVWIIAAPLLVLAHLPNIADFVYFDAPLRLEYHGRIFGAPGETRGSWRTAGGAMRVARYGPRWGRAEVILMTLTRAEDGDWLSHRPGEKEFHPIEDERLASCIKRVEQRARRWHYVSTYGSSMKP